MIHPWRSKYGGMDASLMKRMMAFEAETRKEALEAQAFKIHHDES